MNSFISLIVWAYPSLPKGKEGRAFRYIFFEGRFLAQSFQGLLFNSPFHVEAIRNDHQKRMPLQSLTRSIPKTLLNILFPKASQLPEVMIIDLVPEED